MGYAIKIPNGILTLNYTDFKCPVCNNEHTNEDWWSKYEKSKSGLVYMKCKGCKVKLGVTCDMCGDVRVWEKSKEMR